MASYLGAEVALEHDQSNSNSWDGLYYLLYSQVKALVYSARLPAWYGQEKDVIEEIVQEAICRTFERARKAEKQEAEPIHSLEKLSKTIARHYFIDLIRKDGRIVHLTQASHSSTEEYIIVDELTDPREEVHDDLFQESLFNELAPEIVNFPKKQRQALLIDLANHSHVDGPMSSLGRAFLKNGVSLQDYRESKPENALGRSQYASLLSLAYKRVTHLSCLKPYIAAM